MKKYYKNENIDNIKLNVFFKELFNILEEYTLNYNCDSKSIYICSFYSKYIEFILESNCAKKYEIGMIIEKNNLNHFCNIFSNRINDFDFISIDYNSLENISFLFGKIDIFCYTVNDIIIYKRLLNDGNISGIITDIPEYFITQFK